MRPDTRHADDHGWQEGLDRRFLLECQRQAQMGTLARLQFRGILCKLGSANSYYLFQMSREKASVALFKDSVTKTVAEQEMQRVYKATRCQQPFPVALSASQTSSTLDTHPGGRAFIKKKVRWFGRQKLGLRSACCD